MRIYKVVIIGDAAVGKTSLVTRITQNKFISNMNSTIGASFTSCDLNIENKNIRLNIWDTAGQEKFRSMVSMYYRNANFCIIVFDITKYNLDNIKYWITEYIEKTINSRPKFVLVGNKIDLLEEDFIITDEFQNLIDLYNIKLFKTSTLKGVNINELFEYISKILLDLPYNEINTNSVNLKEPYTSYTSYTSYCCYK